MVNPDPLAVELFPALSERQRCVLPIVLGAPTVKAGLEAAELSRTSWYRWLADPRVAEAWRRLQREAFNEAVGEIRAGARYAASGLLSLLASKNESIRLAACREVLSVAMKAEEVAALEDRILRIEAALGPLVEKAELS